MTFNVCLQPTYGTPVSKGLAQLRVYNGFDCDFAMNIANQHKLRASDEADEIILGALSAYQQLDIRANEYVELPYSINGVPNTECADKSFTGTFTLKEKTANSFFISSDGVTNFVDNNEKVIGGVNVRYVYYTTYHIKNLRT